jgi:hypothetical protein
MARQMSSAVGGGALVTAGGLVAGCALVCALQTAKAMTSNCPAKRMVRMNM